MALSQTTVLKVYKSVMEDVLAGVREIFLDDGVDEQVLVELRHIWENKLMSSKAIDINPDPPEPQPPLVTTTASANSTIASGSVTNHSGLANSLNAAAKKTHQTSLAQPGNNHYQGNTNAPTTNTSTATNTQTAVLPEPNKTVPVQITLPPQAGSADSHSRVLTIQVPASALQGNQLHSVLSGPVISATMALPLHLATSLLQQHVTTALQGQQQAAAAAAAAAAASNNTQANNIISNNTTMHGKTPSIIQANNVGNSSGTGGVLVLGKGPSGLIRQLDGVDDTSDDDDDDEEEEDDAEEEEENDEKDEEEEEENDGGAEEEPLNSEDDVSDEDPTDLFDTDNVVVCQYDKITRSRNKWKFYLKDGIMNLGGKDFVFQRANGDAEW